MNKTNTVIGVFLVIAGLILAGLVGYIFGKISGEEVITEQVEQAVGAAGDSYSTSKIAAKEINVTTTSTASFYNGDSTNRIITETFMHLENATDTPGAPITLYVATSTSATTFGANVNYLWEKLIATTSPRFYASTTDQFTEGTGINIWPAGTYLNFQTNLTFASGTSATYTQTATGLVGVRYLSY